MPIRSWSIHRGVPVCRFSTRRTLRPALEWGMRSRDRRVAAVLGLTAVCLAGCRRAENESVDAYLKQAGPNRPSVSPLAGKVTIDGQPPQFSRPLRLVVMLNDPSNPVLARRPVRQCNDDGSFAFGTYGKQDGVPAGSYVVTFAVLNLTPQGFLGPDQLKNLYNDPDKNALVPDFKIVHQPPGKIDCLFDLKVADQPPVEPPGPNALTELRLPGK
jgi:hypothetical protein